MSRTIKAIERHMTLPVRSADWTDSSRGELGPQSKVPPDRLGLQSRAAKLVAEWQHRGPETLSGNALRKLRLALAPSQSVIIGTAAS
jgi:hypothetical protein